ncbi:MAG: hypothetical protein V1835_07325 [Candidatus Micrarchaeota archaeon]
MGIDMKNVSSIFIYFGAVILLLVLNSTLLKLGWMGSLLQILLVWIATSYFVKMMLEGRKFKNTPDEYKGFVLLAVSVLAYWQAIAKGDILFPFMTTSLMGEIYLGALLGLFTEGIRRVYERFKGTKK